MLCDKFPSLRFCHEGPKSRIKKVIVRHTNTRSTYWRDTESIESFYTRGLRPLHSILCGPRIDKRIVCPTDTVIYYRNNIYNEKLFHVPTTHFRFSVDWWGPTLGVEEHRIWQEGGRTVPDPNPPQRWQDDVRNWVRDPSTRPSLINESTQ